MRARKDDREVILEFHNVGNALKVSAVDPATLREVSIVGDPAVGKETLKRVAIRKLDYVLNREAKAKAKA